MAKSSSRNQKEQSHHVILTQTQKFCSLAVLITIVIISYWPILVGRLALADDYVSKNDLLLFLILPSLQCLLMLIYPILATKISPKLQLLTPLGLKNQTLNLYALFYFSWLL